MTTDDFIASFKYSVLQHAYKNKNVDWAKVSFIIIGILFNPITPIHLSREIWILLDIIVGIISS